MKHESQMDFADLTETATQAKSRRILLFFIGTDMRDIFYIPQHQSEIHARLDNWARWVKPGHGSAVCPMFRMARSNSRQWHQPEIRPTCDTRDAQHIERTIRKLPETHATIIRWWYVWQYPELKIRRQLGLSRDVLLNSIIAARDMAKSLA